MFFNEVCEAADLTTEYLSTPAPYETSVLVPCEAGQSYLVQVRARNSVGWGSLSAYTKIECGAVPAAPTNIRLMTGDDFPQRATPLHPRDPSTSTSAFLSWDFDWAAESSSRTSTKDDSTLLFRLFMESGAGRYFQAYEGRDTRFEIVGLVLGKSYKFYVVAVNGVGESDRSAVFETGGWTAAPAAPRIGPRIINWAEGSATLAWPSVIQNGGTDLTKYLLYRDASLVYPFSNAFSSELALTAGVIPNSDGLSLSFAAAKAGKVWISVFVDRTGRESSVTGVPRAEIKTGAGGGAAVGPRKTCRAIGKSVLAGTTTTVVLHGCGIEFAATATQNFVAFATLQDAGTDFEDDGAISYVRFSVAPPSDNFVVVPTVTSATKAGGVAISFRSFAGTGRVWAGLAPASVFVSTNQNAVVSLKASRATNDATHHCTISSQFVSNLTTSTLSFAHGSNCRLSGSATYTLLVYVETSTSTGGGSGGTLAPPLNFALPASNDFVVVPVLLQTPLVGNSVNVPVSFTPSLGGLAWATLFEKDIRNNLTVTADDVKTPPTSAVCSVSSAVVVTANAAATATLSSCELETGKRYQAFVYVADAVGSVPLDGTLSEPVDVLPSTASIFFTALPLIAGTPSQLQTTFTVNVAGKVWVAIANLPETACAPPNARQLVGHPTNSALFHCGTASPVDVSAGVAKTITLTTCGTSLQAGMEYRLYAYADSLAASSAFTFMSETPVSLSSSLKTPSVASPLAGVFAYEKGLAFSLSKSNTFGNSKPAVTAVSLDGLGLEFGATSSSGRGWAMVVKKSFSAPTVADVKHRRFAVGGGSCRVTAQPLTDDTATLTGCDLDPSLVYELLVYVEDARGMGDGTLAAPVALALPKSSSSVVLEHSFVRAFPASSYSGDPVVYTPEARGLFLDSVISTNDTISADTVAFKFTTTGFVYNGTDQIAGSSRYWAVVVERPPSSSLKTFTPTIVTSIEYVDATTKNVVTISDAPSHLKLFAGPQLTAAQLNSTSPNDLAVSGCRVAARTTPNFVEVTASLTDCDVAGENGKYIFYLYTEDLRTKNDGQLVAYAFDLTGQKRSGFSHFPRVSTSAGTAADPALAVDRVKIQFKHYEVLSATHVVVVEEDVTSSGVPPRRVVTVDNVIDWATAGTRPSYVKCWTYNSTATYDPGAGWVEVALGAPAVSSCLLQQHRQFSVYVAITEADTGEKILSPPIPISRSSSPAAEAMSADSSRTARALPSYRLTTPPTANGISLSVTSQVAGKIWAQIYTASALLNDPSVGSVKGYTTSSGPSYTSVTKATVKCETTYAAPQPSGVAVAANTPTTLTISSCGLSPGNLETYIVLLYFEEDYTPPSAGAYTPYEDGEFHRFSLVLPETIKFKTLPYLSPGLSPSPSTLQLSYELASEFYATGTTNFGQLWARVSLGPSHGGVSPSVAALRGQTANSCQPTGAALALGVRTLSFSGCALIKGTEYRAYVYVEKNAGSSDGFLAATPSFRLEYSNTFSVEPFVVARLSQDGIGLQFTPSGTGKVWAAIYALGRSSSSSAQAIAFYNAIDQAFADVVVRQKGVYLRSTNPAYMKTLAGSVGAPACKRNGVAVDPTIESNLVHLRSCDLAASTDYRIVLYLEDDAGADDGSLYVLPANIGPTKNHDNGFLSDPFLRNITEDGFFVTLTALKAGFLYTGVVADNDTFYSAYSDFSGASLPNLNAGLKRGKNTYGGSSCKETAVASTGEFGAQVQHGAQYSDCRLSAGVPYRFLVYADNSTSSGTAGWLIHIGPVSQLTMSDQYAISTGSAQESMSQCLF